MQTKISYLLLIFLTLLISCQSQENVDDKEQTDESAIADGDKVLELIPINYDFENLNLHLNSSINDSSSTVDWRWDHMNSSNSMPDSIGKDCYMNHDQESFVFHGEETLPALSVNTDRNIIEEFSVTTIFSLEDTTSEKVEEVLSELIKYDLLENDSIKSQLIQNKKFESVNNNYEEELLLEFSDIEYGYSRLTYTTRLK